MKFLKKASKDTPKVRALSAAEIDAVTGGICSPIISGHPPLAHMGPIKK